MSRRWILSAVAVAFLALASHGICRETVKRPVVRFIDFYAAADQAERPLSVFERVTYGLAIAAQPDPAPPSAAECIDASGASLASTHLGAQ